jgi:hypothetical protein
MTISQQATTTVTVAQGLRRFPTFAETLDWSPAGAPSTSSRGQPVVSLFATRRMRQVLKDPAAGQSRSATLLRPTSGC